MVTTEMVSCPFAGELDRSCALPVLPAHASLPSRWYLHAGLREPEALAELLSHEGVRVVRLVKEALQLVELLQREVGATPSLLQLALRVLVLRLHLLLLVLAALVDACAHVPTAYNQCKVDKCTFHAMWRAPLFFFPMKW